MKLFMGTVRRISPVGALAHRARAPVVKVTVCSHHARHAPVWLTRVDGWMMDWSNRCAPAQRTIPKGLLASRRLQIKQTILDEADSNYDEKGTSVRLVALWV